MSFVTVSYINWHILGNKDMCAQFLRDRDLYISKTTGNSNEHQTIKTLWRRVKNKYGIKSCRETDLFEYQQQEEW